MIRRFDGDTLLFATHNSGKLDEMRQLMAPYPIRVMSSADFGLPEPDETETTFAGNARLKARAAGAATGLPVLADDSGLEIDALGGAPGVATADWAETPSGRDFALAMTKTWKLLQDRAAPEPRTARFRCTLLLAWPDGYDEIFEGRIEGRIVWPMRGELGHGYDPIFMPDGYGVTMGEMAPGEKNRISHRANAFAGLVAGCFA